MTQQTAPARESRRERFDAFFDFYYPRVHGWMLARTRDPERARRLTASTLRAALPGMEESDGDVAFQAGAVLALMKRSLRAGEPADGRS